MKTIQKPHIKFLDSARGIAFLLVFIYHLFLESHRDLRIFQIDLVSIFISSFGLYLFFVLSGYLLFKPFVNSVENSQDFPSLKKYFQRRILRIYPAYIFYISLAVMLGIFKVLNVKNQLTVSQILSDIFMLHTFSSQTIFGINGSWWSLAVEFQFYIFLGISMIILKRMYGKKFDIRVLFKFVLGTIIFSELFRIFFYALNKVFLKYFNINYINSETSLIVFRNLPGLLCTFGCGMLLALVLHTKKFKIIVKDEFISWLLGCAVSGLFLINICSTFIPEIIFYFRDLLLSLCWSIILFCFLVESYEHKTIGRLKSIISTKFLVYIGTISYSSYLIHQNILSIVWNNVFINHPQIIFFLIKGFIALFVTIIISAITYQFIEKPFLKVASKSR